LASGRRGTFGDTDESPNKELGRMPSATSKRALDARKVRAARGWANLSQPELATKLEISVATVRRIEQEQRDVSTAELIRISEICAVPRNFMLYGWKGDGKTANVHRSEAQDEILADLAKRMERSEKLHNLYNATARERGVPVDAIVMSHPDEDHETGMAAIKNPPDLVGDLEDAVGKRRRRRASSK
jgi:DNA-binding transcriptional regulator YiaG